MEWNLIWSSSVPVGTEILGPVTLWCILQDQDRSGMERSRWGILRGRLGCGPAASCARAAGSGNRGVDEVQRGLRSLQRMNQKALQQTRWKMNRGGWRDEPQHRGHWGQARRVLEQVGVGGQQGALLGEWLQVAVAHFLGQGWSMGRLGLQHLQGGRDSEAAPVWGNQHSADRQTDRQNS